MTTKFSRLYVVVGTKKGLFLFKGNQERSDWSMAGPFLNGGDVNHAILDPRTATLYATVNDPWFGHHVAISHDLGETWHDNEASPRFAEGSGPNMEKLWHIEPGRTFQDGLMYCGVGPAALFRSEDGGEVWSEMPSLRNHPTAERWFPGNGGLIVHSIVLDPVDVDRMWVAISAGGVFGTQDGGETWQPMNMNLKNIIFKYDPNVEQYPEVGQCIHHLVHAAGDSPRLYAQSHWGTYRSDDGARTWVEITDGLPSDFGLVVAAHPHNPDVAYVVPLEGGEFRCPPEGKLRVYRTSDAGNTWETLTNGLKWTPSSGQR